MDFVLQIKNRSSILVGVVLSDTFLNAVAVKHRNIDYDFFKSHGETASDGQSKYNYLVASMAASSAKKSTDNGLLFYIFLFFCQFCFFFLLDIISLVQTYVKVESIQGNKCSSIM